MPITFWKDRSERTGGAADQDVLRERYIADGRRVAERLAGDERVLAVALSGPFTYPRIAPQSDLHLAVLTAPGGGHYYRHQPSRFSGVGRRLEIAFLPVDYYDTMIGGGLASWGNVFDGHKLCDVEILFERGDAMSDLRRRLDGIRPSRMFVGARIEALRARYAAVRRFIGSGELGEGVLGARMLVTSALELIVVAVWGRLFSKSSHLYAALRSFGPGDRAADYECVHDIEDLGEEAAARIVGMCSDMVRELFERKGVCAAGSD